MFASARPTPFEFEPWGFDNGAYVAWAKGKPWSESLFWKRLDAAYKVNSDPIVAVTPDIVAGGMKSLEFSVNWRLRLPGFWNWYLAVQDGMERDEVLEVMHLFSGIFLGGTLKFKAEAYKWSRLAHFCDKRFHYGRCSTLEKLEHAHAVEADSVDTTYPLWTYKRLERYRDHDLAIRNGEQGAFGYAR
jgi:hypothetical protein